MDFFRGLFPDPLQQDEYIEIREWSRDKKHFLSSLEDIAKYCHLQDTGFGPYTRRGKNSKVSEGAIGFSHVLWVDIDLPKEKLDEDAINQLRKDILFIVSEDYLLSQYYALIFSGRGLHLYFRLPYKTDSVGGKVLLGNLFSYVRSFKLLSNLLDPSVMEVSRIMRMPGTLNSKSGRMCEILDLPKTVVNDDFLKMLSVNVRRENSAVPTREAFILSGMAHLADSSINHVCPFPHIHKGDDRKPSFHYYSDSDTYWCFKCGKTAGWNGVHFLENIGKPDLIPQVRAKLDAPVSPQYNLLKDGTLVKYRKRGDSSETVVVAKFGSDTIVEHTDEIFGRQQFIYFPDGTTIRIDDLPSNRLLKKRYFEIGKSLIFDCETNIVAENLTRYANFAKKKEGVRLVTQPGINGNDYYLDGKLYPRNSSFLKTFIDNPCREEGPCDINKFIGHLMGDNNPTHVIALMWALATTARDIIIKQCKMFPLLVSTGDPKSGKTLLGKMILSMFGQTLSHTLNTTAFSALDILTKAGSIPVHFDEYGKKPLEMDAEERIKGLAVQYPYIEQRGTQDRTVDKYIMTAPVIVTGEKHLRDGGLITRSLVLNVTKNKHTSDEHFIEWMQFVNEFRLADFLKRFLCEYADFRAFVRQNIKEYNRDMLIRKIVAQTWEFCCQRGLIDRDLLDIEQLMSVVIENEKAKTTSTTSEYADMFEALSCWECPKEIGNDRYSSVAMELKENVFFWSGYVILNPIAIHRALNQVATGPRQFLQSSKSIKIILSQAKSFRGVVGISRLFGRHYSTLYSLVVDESNFDFFLNVMKLKIISEYTGDTSILTDKAYDLMHLYQEQAPSKPIGTPVEEEMI